MSQAVLLIFVKNPERGKVKTRLAQGVGDDRALRIYRALLDHTREVAEAVDAQRLLFYSGHVADDDGWSTGHFQKFVQEGEDLGTRMQRAFAEGFRQGKPVVIVGSDCPQLTPRIVEEAIAQLAQHDFAIGPALDGGYYLLGMRTFIPGIFDDIPWSTEEVFSATLRKITDNDWSYALLPRLSDVDYQEDWERYGWPLE